MTALPDHKGLFLQKKICSLWQQILSFKNEPIWTGIKILGQPLPVDKNSLPLKNGIHCIELIQIKWRSH